MLSYNSSMATKPATKSLTQMAVDYSKPTYWDPIQGGLRNVPGASLPKPVSPYGINPAGATQQAITGQKDEIAAGIDREGLYSGTTPQKARTNMEGYGPAGGGANGGGSGLNGASIVGAATSPAALAVAAPVVGAAAKNLVTVPAGGGQGDNRATLTSMLQGQIDRQKANDARIEALYGQISQRANPYDPNSEAFRRSQALAVNNANRAMQGAEHRAQVGLAGRGMLGSGQEAAALGNIAAQRGALISNTENDLYSDTMARGYQWQQARDNSLVSLLNGNRQNPEELARQLALWDRDDANNLNGMIGAAFGGLGSLIAGLSSEERAAVLRLIPGMGG